MQMLHHSLNSPAPKLVDDGLERSIFASSRLSKSTARSGDWFSNMWALDRALKLAATHRNSSSNSRRKT